MDQFLPRSACDLVEQPQSHGEARRVPMMKFAGMKRIVREREDR